MQFLLGFAGGIVAFLMIAVGVAMWSRNDDKKRDIVLQYFRSTAGTWTTTLELHDRLAASGARLSRGVMHLIVQRLTDQGYLRRRQEDDISGVRGGNRRSFYRMPEAVASAISALEAAKQVEV